jgi:hypothetical protein
MLQRQLREKTSNGSDEVDLLLPPFSRCNADYSSFSLKRCMTKSRACKRSWKPRKETERRRGKSRRICWSC